MKLCEHRWLRVRGAKEALKTHIARLTVGRFCGSPIPTTHDTYMAWLRWTAQMLVHLFWREFVLVGDMPAHDWHHRYASNRDWPNALYARQQDLEANSPDWEDPYTEVWGLLNAIDAVFDGLSQLPTYSKPPALQPSDHQKMISGM